jgi:uncharacterized protein (UPF0332 family)
MSEAKLLLAKAERSLETAGRLVQDGDVDFAASRAYYACFYVAQALLRTGGHVFSRHGQVIAQYGLLYAKTGLLDPAFHRLLRTTFELRQVADYQTEVEIDAGVVTELLKEVRRFLSAAVRYLDEKQAAASEPPAPEDEPKSPEGAQE